MAEMPAPPDPNGPVSARVVMDWAFRVKQDSDLAEFKAKQDAAWWMQHDPEHGAEFAKQIADLHADLAKISRGPDPFYEMIMEAFHTARLVLDEFCIMTGGTKPRRKRNYPR